MEFYQKDFIKLALSHQALQFGDFTLKSGRKSPYFFNVGQLNSGQTLGTLGEAYAQAILQSDIQFDGVFGPAYKGIPLACTAAIALGKLGHDKTYSFDRKEAKDHGEKGLIVGAPLRGRVLIIDDVITAGTAIRSAFQTISQAQATVAGIVVALDRQEKGQKALSAVQEIQSDFGVPVISIITLNHLIEYSKQETFSQYLPALESYRQTYGVDDIHNRL